MLRSLALPLSLAVLAGCAAPPPPTPQSQANAAVRASCQANTERAFNKQNRYLLSERDTTDSPFSSSGVTGITTRGLSQRYEYDQDLANCIKASGGNGRESPAAVEPQPPTGTPVAPY